MTTHNDKCGHNHSEVQHKIMELSQEVMMATMEAMIPDVLGGKTEPAMAGMIAATMLFANALETGLQAALIDPIGAQLIIDHLNDTVSASREELDEANRIIAVDARELLEAAARM